MTIRTAEVKDAREIKILLEQLGYLTEEIMVQRRLEVLSSNREHMDIVYELDHRVLGFLSLHFIPQIAFDAEYLVVSYLVVDERTRSKGVGAALEEYAVKVARERNCRRILLSSNARRTDAHRFYIRQGYELYQKAFVKYL